MAHGIGRLARSLYVTGAKDGDRVTTLELLFDLVYVFAFTQVTNLLYHAEPPASLVDSFIVLSLLWWSWCSFSWLANQARADRGILQVAFVLAMVVMFIACLAIPDAFHGAAGGFSAAGVLVVCYVAVRLIHAGVYFVVARGEERLRRRIVVTMLTSFGPTVAFLVCGVLLGEPFQRWIWLAAVLFDCAGVFATAAAANGWLIPSAAHFAERYSLVVILALGESVVDIGVGLASKSLDWHTALGAVLSILLAIGLWFAYFDRVVVRLERSLAEVRGAVRAKLGRDVYTYLHFPIIAGIIVAATGIELAMSHLDEDRVGVLAGGALAGGVALFLAGTAGAAARAHRERVVARVVAAAFLVALSPLLSLAEPLIAVGAVAGVVVLLAVIESASEVRRAPGRP